MLIGLLGNPLVIYFYGYRLNPTPSYMFITSLACYDLLSCLISMPLEMVDLLFFLTFQSPLACRLLRFVNHFVHIASGGTLLAIAIDRFRKLCRPLDPQFTKGQAKYVIIIMVGLSLLCSWPSLVFYTVVDVNITTSTGSITGQDCSTESEGAIVGYIMAYNVFLFLLFIGGLVAILVIYSMIARTIFNLRSFKFYTSKPSNGIGSSLVVSTLTITSDVTVNSVNQDIENIISTRAVREFNGSTDDLRDTARGLTPIEEDHGDDSDDSDDDSMLSEKEIDDLTQGDPLDDYDDEIDDEIPELPVQKISNRMFDLPAKWTNRVTPDVFQKDTDYTDFDEDDFLDDLSVIGRRSAKPKPIRQTQSFTERPVQRRLFSGPTARRTRSEMQIKTVKLFQANNPSRISWTARSARSVGSAAGETRNSRCTSVDVDQKRMRAQNINTRKFTLIAVSITVAFIVSFLPYLALAVWSTLSPNHEANVLNPSELVSYQIFIRSFLFNSVCNPLIYGLLNVEFKNMIVNGFKQFILLLRCTCKCNCKCPKIQKHKRKVTTVHVAEAKQEDIRTDDLEDFEA